MKINAPSKRSLLNYYLTFLLSTCFLLISLKVKAQQQLSVFDTKSVHHNISQRAITCFLKDNDGYMWIGTRGNGLFKYDGVEFKQYVKKWEVSKALVNNTINKLYLDKSFRLWVATENGIQYYNKINNQFKSITYNGTPLMANIHAIKQTKNGLLLVGTHKEGLFIVDPYSLEAKSVNYASDFSLVEFEINDIIGLNDDLYWLATNKGLMRYELTSNTLSIENKSPLTTQPLITFNLDSKGNIWIGTFQSGVIKFDLLSREFENFNFTSKRILALSNHNDKILVATENDGLFILNYDGVVEDNLRQVSFENSKLKSNSIWSLYVDKKDRIWIGYYDKGFDVFDLAHNKFYSLADNFKDAKYQNIGSVQGISSTSDDILWIATNDNGLFRYNKKLNTIAPISNSKSNYKGLNSKDITSVYVDVNKNLWVGTWTSGLYILSANSKRFVNYNMSSKYNRLESNRIMTFAGDKNGDVWIGSFLGGIMKYDNSTKRISHINNNNVRELNLDNANIRKLLLDSNNNLWIGSRKGLFRFDLNANNNDEFEIKNFNLQLNNLTRSSTTTPIVLSLFEDYKGHIWIGTQGFGLFSYDTAKNNFEWFHTKDGLQQETVNSINTVNNETIWIAGNKGISSFIKTKNLFKNYNTNDGLMVNNFNTNASFIERSGVLMFGNAQGINVFNPNTFKINTEKPLIHVTGIEINNQSSIKNSHQIINPDSTVDNKVELDHGQSVFTVNYVGINFTRGKQNQYAYKLEGFEKEWNYVGNKTSATYTNIPPGDYIFKVKAANNEGFWNENPETISITLSKPWWTTNLMLITYVLIGLTLGFIIYDLTKSKLRQRQAIKSERIKLLQTESLNAKKIQFFTNISHEFRTPLTLILNPLEALLNSSYHFPDEIKSKLNIIHKNTNRLFRLIDELMDFRKLQFNKLSIKAKPTNINDFLKQLVTHFEEEAFMRKIQFNLFQERLDELIWIDPSLFEKIIFNLLSNAFKATADGGAITISVKPNSQIIIPAFNPNEKVKGCLISIKDNGVGVKKEDIDKIFDRFYQTEALDQQYYGGTGIGLEVVRSFIELHKGHIEVVSDGVSGSEFIISIPIGNTHFSANEIDYNPTKEIFDLNEKITPRSTNKIASEHKPQILIVEDNIELRLYLTEQLENEYNIIEAKNGVQGLKIAQKFVPELIISDVMMPLMNGFDFCEQLKGNSQTSHIPVIMLTAKILETDRLKGINSGAEVYLKKPFSITLLKTHIKQLIQSRKLIFEKYYKGIINNDLTNSKDKDFISSVLNYVHENIGNTKLNVEFMAKELHLSRSKLYRKIKTATGDSANEFIRKIRLEKAKEYLEQTDKTVSEICYAVGFSSPSYFSKCYKQYFGEIPKKDRKVNQ